MNGKLERSSSVARQESISARSEITSNYPETYLLETVKHTFSQRYTI
jgi:hypothetical protein